MKVLTMMVSLLMAATTATVQTLPYQDRNLSAQERAKDLCERLTIEEKTALMMDRSPEIKRLGIPAFHCPNAASASSPPPSPSSASW